MTWAMDRYRDYMAEEGDDGLNRGHLHNSGYEYDDGYWYATFENKLVVARKDHPKFGIVKGQKHRFIKIKYICDETGCSSWRVQRRPLRIVDTIIPKGPAPVNWGSSTKSSWGTPTPTPNPWNTDAWTRKDK